MPARGWWGQGGPQETGWHSNGSIGGQWVGKTSGASAARAPMKPEVEEELEGLVVKSEKFRDLGVN